MTSKDQIAEDINDIQNELGNKSFLWNGVTHYCVPSTANKSKVVDVGGFALESDLILSVVTSSFSGSIYPVPQQDKITYSGKVYRIIQVGDLNHGAAVRLHCVDEFKMR